MCVCKLQKILVSSTLKPIRLAFGQISKPFINKTMIICKWYNGAKPEINVNKSVADDNSLKMIIFRTFNKNVIRLTDFKKLKLVS